MSELAVQRLTTELLATIDRLVRLEFEHDLLKEQTDALTADRAALLKVAREAGRLLLAFLSYFNATDGNQTMVAIGAIQAADDALITAMEGISPDLRALAEQAPGEGMPDASK